MHKQNKSRLALFYPALRLHYAALTLCLVSGCASQPEPIHTRDDFSSKINELGTTEFVYLMSWYLPEKSRKESKMNFWRQVLGDGSTISDTMRLDNETRLMLEDQAVQKLQQQLDSRDLCPDQYKINLTQWRDRAIRLTGECL